MTTLYVVATPLGNLEDITRRAVRVLKEASVVYAEDTRRTLGLLQHLGISRALYSLHEHNEVEKIGRVLADLQNGRTVALVSDAGTPLVSDPGAHLVAATRAAGYPVSPVVGPSALAAAMSVSGFPMENMLFVGFIPHKGRRRSEALERVVSHVGAVVLYESPHRAQKTLSSLADVQPSRPACALREMTKLHEEIVDGTLADLARWASSEIRGELTVVLGPWSPSLGVDDLRLEHAIKKCLAAGLSARDTAAAVAAWLEHPRRDVYRMVQSMDAST